MPLANIRLWVINAHKIISADAKAARRNTKVGLRFKSMSASLDFRITPLHQSQKRQEWRNG
jgi:hypothetical protein